MSLSAEQFIASLSQSGLLPGEAIRQVQSDMPRSSRPPDAAALAREFVRQGKLTPFQAEVLRESKPVPLVLADYIVLDRIAAGGMSEVFKAVHRRMEQIVALKVLLPESTKDADLLARFKQEAKAAARLKHPNIVTAYNAGEEQGVQFLAMEYVEGSDLNAYVRKRGGLTVREAIDFVRQAARGLDHAHRQGVIHRDVKPSNLILDASGIVRVLDLGLAAIVEAVSTGRPAAARLTVAGETLGTANYMSPEQSIDTRDTDARSDIYSLGCTLHYLLIARPPFSGRTSLQLARAHQSSPVPSLRDKRPDVPESLDGLFRLMMAKRPADRPQTMSELIDRLDKIELPQAAESTGEWTAEDLSGKPKSPGENVRDTVLDRAIRRTAHDPLIPPDSDYIVIDPGRFGRPKRVEDTPDRLAAEWVLAMGGTVIVAVGDEEGVTRRRVRELDGLPPEVFVLETVGLAYNKLVADADLIRFTGQSCLRRLDLDGTNISDAGLKHVGRIASLNYLSLAHTGLTDAGVSHLTGLKQLEHLSLYGTRVTDAAAAVLAQMHWLEKLNVTNTAVTENGVERLRGGLSECLVLS